MGLVFNIAIESKFYKYVFYHNDIEVMIIL